MVEVELASPFVLQWPAGLLMKARPATEGDTRLLFLEPSNENWDLQGERVMQEGLAKSAGHFRQFGIIDIAHFSMPGMAKAAIDHGFDPVRCRIGKPIEVRTESPIMVKALIFAGEGREFEYSNWFWKTLEAGMPWYPSVGGATGPTVCGPGGCSIVAPLWNNIGMWNEPMNPTVKPASMVPFGHFTKALTKALTSGVATDAAHMTGGQALQRESLAGAVQHRDDGFVQHAKAYLAKIKGGGTCDHVTEPITTAKAQAHFERCQGIDSETARSYALRMMARWHSNITNSAAEAAA